MKSGRSTSPRLLIHNNIPSFYRTRPFASLVEAWRSETGGDARVLYQARRDLHQRDEWFHTPDHELGFQHTFLSRSTVKIGGRVTYSPRVPLGLLRRFRPTHLLVPGWDTPSALTLAAYTRLTGAVTCAWVESNESTSSSRWRGADAYRRFVLSSASGILAPTSASERFVTRLTGQVFPVLRLPNPVDLPRVPESGNGDLCPRLIFVGDLSRRKGFDVFAEAVRVLGAGGWSGIAFGTDTEGLAQHAPRNCDVISGLHLSEIVPRLDPDRDLWVIPSRVDPAPLTFSEAIALGFRVALSDGIAYSEDVSGFNGTAIFRSMDPSSLVAAVEILRGGPRPGPDDAKTFSAESWAENLTRFILDLG